MTTSRIILPDGTGRTVQGRALAHVGKKLNGSEFPELGRGNIDGYTITRIHYSAHRDHYSFFTN